jgi:hypothetical protein
MADMRKDRLRTVSTPVEIALDRVPRHRLIEQALDLAPDLLDAKVSFGLDQDFDNGAADAAEAAPAVGCWAMAFRRRFSLFTPQLTCEILE